MDFWIDVGGIGGDLVKNWGELGNTAFHVSEAAEFIGALKGTHDLIQGKPLNASLFTLEKVVTNGSDYLRVARGVGVIFNLVSIGFNIAPAINTDAVHIVPGD